jgi:cytochrome c biogenesis protein ResB
MIRKVWRRIERFLTSAGLVIGLLVFVGLWSMAATFVAQGEASIPSVAAWATANPAVESVVRTIGLHQAFTSWVFLVCVLLLGLSTALCAWRRTKVAIRRSRMLRKAAIADGQPAAASHDLEIPCDPDLSGPEVLSIASETLGRLGIRAKRRDDVLAAVSSPLSVWGSPVFHWALLALMLVILTGNLLRSDGLMGIAVGQTKADAPSSYGVIHTGPVHDWSRVQRSFRLDTFEPDFKTGGIDRGPTPTVSVLDGAGNVVITQRVYPNMMLHSGSLSISAPACGLSATISLVNTSGVEAGRSIQLVDFSQTTTDGTVPVEYFTVAESSGKPLLQGGVEVPLDRVGGRFRQGIPSEPKARVVMYSPEGAQVLDSVIKPGEEVALPTGGRLRLIDIGWYSRLSIVDDPTTPLLYVAMAVAMIGLAVAALARQQLLVARVVTGPDGSKLAVQLRLWRNVPTCRAEIAAELAQALGSDEKESVS